METKRKLVYIIHGIAVGGAEVALLSALPKLHQAFDLNVFVLGEVDAKLTKNMAAAIQGRMVYFKAPKWALPFYLPLIYAKLKRFSPDIMITSLWRSTIPAMLYKFFNKRVQYFLMLHSNGFFHWSDRFFTSNAMRMSDAIFVDSIATKDFAISVNGTKSEIKILSYLIHATSISPPVIDFSGKKKFLFVGSLSKVKRVPLAVSTIAWLRRQGIDATLSIYGRDEGERSTIEEQIRHAGMQEYVSLMGEVSPGQKKELHASYNFYIQLSAQEGMSMSVAEAMQYGMVVFVTPVGEIPNYARDGVSAIFANTNTAESWNESMEKLLVFLQDEEKCKAISRAAAHTFEDKPIFSDSLVETIFNL